jgi:hypothetical protein
MSSHAPERTRRWPVLVLVPAAILAAGLADRTAPPTAPRGPRAVQPAPVAAPLDAYSSSWFCGGAADSAASSTTGAPTGSVVVYNPTSRIETATVRVFSTSGNPVAHQVAVPPTGTTSVAENVAGGPAWTGAEVEVDGSSVVEEVLDGPMGRVIGQCATSGSPQWYFPNGQTLVNADETILLMNPFPSLTSVVDMSFTTENGQEQPQAFESISVGPGQLVAVDLRSHLRRRSAIAVSVKARVGRIVAWSEEVVSKPTAGQAIVGTPAASAPLADPASPVPGVTLSLGAPSTGRTWTWPDGLSGPGMDEEYLVYNPGSMSATVSLAVGLAQGSAEPFSLTVGPGQVVPIVSRQETRIPDGAPHTAVLTSTNGVPVVGLRTETADSASAQLLGIGALTGERLPASEWIVPATAADASHHGQVIVFNPADGPVSVTLGGATASTETVAAHGRSAVAVTKSGPLTVSASGPVYVEYDLYGVGTTPGYCITSAVPIAGS